MPTNSGTVALNNYLQATNRLTALSWDESTTGLEHSPMWTCVCKINGKPYGTGTGMNKQAARDVACKVTLEGLVMEEQD